MTRAAGHLLSYVLRHRPDAIGVSLDARGSIALRELSAALVAHGHALSVEAIGALVAGDDKGRFVIEGERIRARQGHSVPVDLALNPVVPPERLFHGTSSRFLPRIREHGLLRGARHHVHLSPDRATAERVAARRKSPIVLVVGARALHEAGHKFYRTDNGVWLVETVPPAFLIG